jgi:hypothetical protein
VSTANQGGWSRERAESGDSEDDDGHEEDNGTEDGSFSFKDMFSQHFGNSSSGSPNGDVDPEMSSFVEDLFRRAEHWDRRSYFKNRKKFKSPQALFEAAEHNIALKRDREENRKREEKRFAEELESRKRAADENRDWSVLEVL